MLNLRFLLAFLSLLFIPSPTFANPSLNFKPVLSAQSDCPTPALERLQRHRVTSGETIETIANQYRLIPATLIRFNHSLERTPVNPGMELSIPPMNGTQVQVPRGTTWQNLAETYGVRADVLFEINGCQDLPTKVFIPGVNWTGNQGRTTNSYTGLSGYPLPQRSEVSLAYGWRSPRETGQRFFHSGIDLLASIGTNVLAADAGVVLFAGTQGDYGNLVIINHAGGLQTRYGHLEAINVQQGQNVQTGARLGTVGITGEPDITPPHLHFEVRYNSASGWVAQNPLIHLRPQD